MFVNFFKNSYHQYLHKNTSYYYENFSHKFSLTCKYARVIMFKEKPTFDNMAAILAPN